MNFHRKHAVMLVVGTLAAIALLYSFSLAACALFKIEPSPEVLNALKDIGLVALGGLTGLLARTSTQEQPPNEHPAPPNNLGPMASPDNRNQ